MDGKEMEIDDLGVPLFSEAPIWMFPKIVGFPPKSSTLIGFSIIFTIHFGGLFLDFHPYFPQK